ncbi:O-acetylserine/cysteine exporter [Leeia oryzae]|uniref:O-acetylserine/cysteine exporter n=1 Tax=Leeia oryzae TaxID=356662 RepID=UPI000363308B|nr:O-acetylserine/cysteine exporter [Leeia oryzae]
MPFRHLLLALLIVLVWGVNFVVIKFGLHGIPPLMLGGLRFLTAALPAVFLVPRPKVPFKLYLAYGLTISVGQFGFLFTAIHVGMPTGLTSVVLQSQAFFTLLFSALFLKEHWQINQLLGLFLAAGGLLLIALSHGVGMPIAGFLFTLAAASMWATGNIVTRQVAKHGPINMFAFVIWASLVPPIPFFLLSLVFEGPSAIAQAVTHIDLVSIAAIAYLAWVATLLGYGLWSKLLSMHPANKVAPFSLLVPVVGLITAWLVFGEQLSGLQWGGCALLMFGLIVNVFGASGMRWYRQKFGVAYVS